MPGLFGIELYIALNIHSLIVFTWLEAALSLPNEQLASTPRFIRFFFLSDTSVHT